MWSTGDHKDAPFVLAAEMLAHYCLRYSGME